jgi:hypothetical protein
MAASAAPVVKRRRSFLLAGWLALYAPLAGAMFTASYLGCDNSPKPVIIKGPDVQPVADVRWATMRAVHRVHIDAAKGDGREQNNLRGMIAVERPDRFRLQAYGPGNVTLFDIIKVGGDIRIVQGMKGADTSLQSKVLLSIGADLAAAYDLEPRLPSRQKLLGLKEGELRIVETERTIRAQQFKEVQGQSIPTHMEIDNEALNYKVSIDVESATLDDKLDPSLFRISN